MYLNYLIMGDCNTFLFLKLYIAVNFALQVVSKRNCEINVKTDKDVSIVIFLWASVNFQSLLRDCQAVG